MVVICEFSSRSMMKERSLDGVLEVLHSQPSSGQFEAEVHDDVNVTILHVSSLRVQNKGEFVETDKEDVPWLLSRAADDEIGKKIHVL